MVICHVISSLNLSNASSKNSSGSGRRLQVRVILGAHNVPQKSSKTCNLLPKPEQSAAAAIELKWNKNQTLFSRLVRSICSYEELQRKLALSVIRRGWNPLTTRGASPPWTPPLLTQFLMRAANRTDPRSLTLSAIRRGLGPLGV